MANLGPPTSKPRFGGASFCCGSWTDCTDQANCPGFKTGLKLCVNYLRDLARIAAQLIQATLPMKERMGSLRSPGDPEECLKWGRRSG
jgi:hypothetical protein